MTSAPTTVKRAGACCGNGYLAPFGSAALDDAGRRPPSDRKLQKATEWI